MRRQARLISEQPVRPRRYWLLATHTAKDGPWSIDVAIEFTDQRRAIAFERYLKSGSGVAFAHRHLR